MDKLLKYDNADSSENNGSIKKTAVLFKQYMSWTMLLKDETDGKWWLNCIKSACYPKRWDWMQLGGTVWSMCHGK